MLAHYETTREKMSVAEMRAFRWMFSITTKDRIKNMHMHRHLGVVRVGYKFKRDSFEMVWVKFRLITTLVRKSFSMQIDDPLW